MADAYVRYRAGGGTQKVSDYDYVFNTRQLIESGTYRDSGYVPSVIVSDQSAPTFGMVDSMTLGYGSSGQYNNAVTAVMDVGSAGSATNLLAVAPDEMMHTEPRQLSYRETTLTFCSDSDSSVTLTPDHTADDFTAVAHGLAGKRFVISSTGTMPAGILTSVLYYPVNVTDDAFQVSLSENGSPVTFTSDGTGVITATVVTTIAEFMWSNILGWSNNPPSR
jgi:hypothetical protein